MTQTQQRPAQGGARVAGEATTTVPVPTDIDRARRRARLHKQLARRRRWSSALDSLLNDDQAAALAHALTQLNHDQVDRVLTAALAVASPVDYWNACHANRTLAEREAIGRELAEVSR